MDLYTIGHSNHPIDKFIRRLAGLRVVQLVDVRSTPYSRFHPQYNKNALQQVLLAHSIEYIWAGESLGGRPKDPSCYKHQAIPSKNALDLHEVSYPEVMQRRWFIQGIQDLLELADQQSTCILCAEKDPALCHRHHLIARYLEKEYPEVTIWHILGDGSLIDAKSIHNPDNPSGAEQLSF
jgi:uncharacterized protein (DUF488 family)